MSFLATMREILQREGLRAYAEVTMDTARVEPPPATQHGADPVGPCRLCGSDSWWRHAPAAPWQCRRCRPPARLPVAEVLSLSGASESPLCEPRKDWQAWLTAWQEITQLTAHITVVGKHDAIQSAMDRCDDAFEHDDWPAFQEAAEVVKRLVHGAP